MLTRRATLAGMAALGFPSGAGAQGFPSRSIKTRAGIDMLHVPFKGLSPMLTELLADRIDISIAPLPGLIGQQIESGSVRALGLARAERVPQLASVPTFAESGVPGVEADAWSALFAPARTPAPVIERLYLAIATALSKDAVRAAMAKQGIPPALKTPAEVAAMLPGEVAKWAAVIKASNVVMD